MDYTTMLTILAVLIGGVIIFYMCYRHHKLILQGKIIERDCNFVEKAEDFILTLEDPSLVVKRLRSLPYEEIKASMRAEDSGCSFLFTSSTWNARLYRKNDDVGKAVYSFQFLQWKTHNGGIQYEVNMNMLLTAIEKMFLGIDPDTQVKTQLLETKTSHRFFG